MASSRAERRLSAILAADVVGFSHLVEQDEAGTLAALKDLRREVIDPLLTEYTGRIVKLMGDGAIVEFGSVVDAVACADAIQKGVAHHQAARPADRRILFRIGVNLGDVVVEGSDLMGDGVNIAARLEQICPPGAVMISGTAYDQLQGKLDLPVTVTGKQRVKNIDRPIRTYVINPGIKQATARRFVGRLRRWAPAGAMILLLLGLAGGLASWLRSSGSMPSVRPAIAALPFDNLPGDDATRRLADGITEDIITDLSRFRDLDVIARNTTSTFKKPVDVRSIGKVLNVSYVLEGSLQRQGDRIRVVAQLIDTATGTHVWSSRWDRPAADLFALQSEVAEQVAAKLGGAFGVGTISAVEIQRARRRPPTDLTAYEHYLLAAEAKSLRRPEMGVDHAEKAVELDPNFARAYTARGWLRYFRINAIEDWKREIDLVGNDFRWAVLLDPADAEARMALGVYLIETGHPTEAAVEFDRAIDHSPANALILAVVAGNLPYLGRTEEAVVMADKALRLDPYMPHANRGALKDAYFFARRFDRTVEEITAIPEASRSRWATVVLAASYAMLGKVDEAAAAKTAMIARVGETSAEYWLNDRPPFTRSAERDVFVETFRKLDLLMCYTDEQAAKLTKPRRLPECVPR